MVKASTELATARPYFDVFSLFERETGLNLLDFYALMFGAISRFAEFDPIKYLNDPGSYSLDDHWFSSTKITPDAIERFFGLISGTPDYFANRLSTNTGPNDFTAFRDRPTLRASPKLDLIDFSMLTEKFESGPFWAIHSKLDQKERSAFHAFWGKLFEKYIGNLLMNSANGKRNRVYVSPLFDGTDEEFADLAVVCGQSLVLLELKGTTFTAKAKYEGDHTRLRQELESKLVESEDRPQGIRQLAKNITRGFGSAREMVRGLDLTYVRTVFPVMVTRDDLGGVPGVNAFLEIRFNELFDRKSVGTSVAPLTCMSSEIIESLSPYLADTSFAQTIESQIAANRRGQARYQTMPFFAVRNTVLANRGERPIPNQSGTFDELIDVCLDRLGLSPLT